jgi:hypothetical protein
MTYPALLVTAIVLLLAVFTLALTLVRQQVITAEVKRELATFTDEERHLVHTRLPALVESATNPSVVVPGPLRVGESDPHGAVVDAAGQLVERARREATQEAEAVTRAVVRSAQNLASEQQLLLSEMQDRHDDPEMLEELLGLDHANSQLIRTLQSVAVLCGSWPGQQRAVASLTDVVRGAIGRIRDYRRVEVPLPSEVAVVSQAVEPVVLALAALLDNATRYSQPGSIVQVGFQHGHNGHAIVIDDAGVGMTSESVRRAHWLLEGQTGQNFAVVGSPPQIGFAVIGVLAARYGFRVSVDTLSPYGGVRAVLFLPNNLLTSRERSVVLPRPSPVPRRSAPEQPAPERSNLFEPQSTNGEPATNDPPGSALAEVSEEAATTASGLPRRRRRTPAVVPGGPASPEAQPAARPLADAADAGHRSVAAAIAWQRGTREGRTNESTEKESS